MFPVGFMTLSQSAVHSMSASTNSVGVGSARPTALSLAFTSGNPARGSVALQYGLPNGGSVSLTILDVQGREVAVLAKGSAPAGWHTASWNGQSERGRAAAGLYFARLRVGDRSLIERFVLTR